MKKKKKKKKKTLFVCVVSAWRKRSRGLGASNLHYHRGEARNTGREEAEEDFLCLPVREWSAEQAVGQGRAAAQGRAAQPLPDAGGVAWGQQQGGGGELRQLQKKVL